MKSVKLMPAVLLALVATGCWEPESSYDKLVKEKEALLVELKEAKTESVILGSALQEIYKERDALLTKISNLESARKSLTGESVAEPAETTSAAGRPAAPQAAGAARTYKVKAGDSLSGVAIAHGVSLPAILQANPTVAGRPGQVLYVGQDLIIP